MALACFLISTFFFAAAIILTVITSLKPYSRNHFFKASIFLTVGVFLSSTALFFPLNYLSFHDYATPWLTTLLASAHTALRLFIVDCDFEFIFQQTSIMDAALQNCYIVFSTILFMLSPILTASVVLSFLENVSAQNRYIFSFFKDAYVFSELNERSLSLAKSIKHADPKRVIVFTDVFKKEDESSFEFIERAKEIDAILFKNDVTLVNFAFHSKKKKLYFFIIGNDEVENVNQTIRLTSSREKQPKVKDDNAPRRSVKGYDYPCADNRVYIFSTSNSTEQHLSAMAPQYIKLRRVSDVQSLVYNLLYNDGEEIFKAAKETGNTVYNAATKSYDPEKKISAIVLGLGSYGTEMVRALTWFAQMHPYRLEINVFDQKKHVDSVFRSNYPELFDINPAKQELPEPTTDANGNATVYPFRNGDFTTPGEAHYKISIHTGYNVTHHTFDEKLKELSDATYVFVALGNDDINVCISTKMRILMKRMGADPLIHTIICNPNKQDMLKYGHNVSGQSYDIRPYGDIHSTYSEECVLNSELEKAALDRHLAYVKMVVANEGLTGEDREKKIRAEEETFWKYDYNYRSSRARIIHERKSDKLGTRNAAQEHRRWNAYMRSMGYCFSGSVEEDSRNDLARLHHNLVPFANLRKEGDVKKDN